MRVYPRQCSVVTLVYLISWISSKRHRNLYLKASWVMKKPLVVLIATKHRLVVHRWGLTTCLVAMPHVDMSALGYTGLVRHKLLNVQCSKQASNRCSGRMMRSLDMQIVPCRC